MAENLEILSRLKDIEENLLEKKIKVYLILLFFRNLVKLILITI